MLSGLVLYKSWENIDPQNLTKFSMQQLKAKWFVQPKSHCSKYVTPINKSFTSHFCKKILSSFLLQIMHQISIKFGVKSSIVRFSTHGC